MQLSLPGLVSQPLYVRIYQDRDCLCSNEQQQPKHIDPACFPAASATHTTAERDAHDCRPTAAAPQKPTMSKFRFGAPSPKQFIEKLAANDASTTSVDLSNNALFKMKAYEYTGQLVAALKKNTHCTSLIFKVERDRQRRMYFSEGVATDEHLTHNLGFGGQQDRLRRGQAHSGRDPEEQDTDDTYITVERELRRGCMDSWLAAFNDNVTLTTLKWRLDSRKSFKLNKDITRNNSIVKWRADGADWAVQTLMLPDHLKPAGSGRRQVRFGRDPDDTYITAGAPAWTAGWRLLMIT